jgi:SAM-dependent methyltransferase
MLGDSNANVFDTIYREGMWGHRDDAPFYSGSGSYDPAVQKYVQTIRNLIEERGVKSIVDIGCGDFSVGRLYADAGETYLGVDVAPNIISYNKEAFSTANISFTCADAAREDLPASDLCSIRQVLQHLSNRDIAEILRRVRVHRLVLITEHLPAPSQLRRPNLDKRAGPDTRMTFGSGVFVDQPPFNFPCRVVLENEIRTVQLSPGEILRTILWEKEY